MRGKGLDDNNRLRLHKDHPRLCGEKRLQVFSRLWSLGSPPPMRGKVRNRFRPFGSVRITPAYAGKSFKFFRCRFSIWDHPRLCGEKIFVFRSSAAFAGSPPPMRGKGWRSPPDWRSDRITPAYAGKRFCSENIRYCE